MDDLLIVLTCIAPLAIHLLATRGRGDRRAAYACVGLGLAFLYFAAGHFAVTDELVVMLPSWLPARKPLILATGVLELLIAIGLLGLFGPRLRPAACIAAALVLVLFLPANVYAALHHVGVGQHKLGPVYLLVRIPLQVFLFAWACWPLRWPDPAASRPHRGIWH